MIRCEEREGSSRQVELRGTGVGRRMNQKTLRKSRCISHRPAAVIAATTFAITCYSHISLILISYEVCSIVTTVEWIQSNFAPSLSLKLEAEGKGKKWTGKGADLHTIILHKSSRKRNVINADDMPRRTLWNIQWSSSFTFFSTNSTKRRYLFAYRKKFSQFFLNIATGDSTTVKSHYVIGIINTDAACVPFTIKTLTRSMITS